MCRILGQPVPALQESCLSFLFLEDGGIFMERSELNAPNHVAIILDVTEDGQKNDCCHVKQGMLPEVKPWSRFVRMPIILG